MARQGCSNAPRIRQLAVLVGAETSEDGANRLAERIRQDSLEKMSAFVVRIDSATQETRFATPRGGITVWWANPSRLLRSAD